MRIGIDARMLGKKQATGIGNYIEQLIKRILKLDNTNQYFLFVKPENKKLAEKIIQESNIKNAKIIITKCHWYSLCEQIKFCFLLYKTNLDLVHFPQFNVPIFYFKKFIVSIHDITALKYPGPKMKSKLRQLAFSLVFKKAINSSKKILTISNYTKNQIIKYYPKVKDKIVITYLGVEKDFDIEVNYGKIKEIKEQFNITKPYIFYVGVWRKHKNIHGLIKAFEILKKFYNLDIQLVLGGLKNQDYKELDQVFNKIDITIKNDIIETGFIKEKDLPYVYQGAQAYIVPSFEEGFGLNGLEAMLSKVPLIVSKTGSLKEIYNDSAIYFNPYKPTDIAHKINQTLKNQKLKDNLIKNGSQQVKKYNWNTTASETLKLYNKILKKTKR